MTEDLEKLQTTLYDHKVYSAWQFIQYTNKNINTVRYCYQTINSIISKLTTKTVRWQQDLFSDFVEEVTEDGRKIKRFSVTVDKMPTYSLHVAGEKVNPWFLFDMLLRDFFQYTMNAFDSISQIANAGLLANKGKKVDSVDFQRMASCFEQATYSAEFPKTSAWFTTIKTSTEFQYIEATNNRTKHTADIANKLSMGLLGSSNETKIGPFFRKDVQHDKKELSDQLQATIDFLIQSFSDFLVVFNDEVVLDLHTENRRHEIGGVYQQSIKDNPDQNLSYAFIYVEKDFVSMPNELYILFANKTYKINADICPFEHILVCDGKPLNVLGRYVAEEPSGEDCLLYYRKYVKDIKTVGASCLFLEMSNSTTFYHKNEFFNITVVSDDQAFISRSALPF